MIEKINEKPFILLVIPAILFFVFSFIPTNETIDIQLHDSYTVIVQSHVFIAVIFVLLSILGLYFLFQKFLWSKKLTWIHVITTSVLLLYISSFSSILFSSFEVPRRYYTYNEFEKFSQYAIINKTISISVIILFFSQFLFIINIVIGSIKKSHKS